MRYHCAFNLCGRLVRNAFNIFISSEKSKEKKKKTINRKCFCENYKEQQKINKILKSFNPWTKRVSSYIWVICYSWIKHMYSIYVQLFSELAIMFGGFVSKMIWFHIQTGECRFIRFDYKCTFNVHFSCAFFMCLNQNKIIKQRSIFYHSWKLYYNLFMRRY